MNNTTKRIAVLFLFAVFNISLSAQSFSLSGMVLDSESGTQLKFANIRVAQTTNGTAANSEGRFILKLREGKHLIIVSYLGYKSDSLLINLTSNRNIKFQLQPISIQLSEITVLPGKNPALEIIKRAIDVKHDRQNKLNSYIADVYTKGWIKTKSKIVSGQSGGVNVSVFGGKADSSKLEISGIIENESISYFKKPDFHKEKIIAQKQSANFPSTINIVTGGRIIQNFYDDDVQFFNRPLPSPLSDYALGYYYYYIADTLAQDNTNIFKIYFAPISNSDPGFYGNIFITDKTFNLVKVVAHLNNAANPGGLLTKNTIFQQFAKFNGIYMPIDYRLFAGANYLGIAKFGFSLNTVMRNYQINPKISDDIFSKAVVTVLPNADKKDSTYWKATIPTPHTSEEAAAYKRIDSLESIPKTFWDNFSILSSSVSLSDNVSVSGPLYIYHFNRVSGHALNFRLFFKNYLDRRFYSTFNFGYGFSDKKFSTSLKSKYLFGEYRTTALRLKAYNGITELFGESDNYNLLSSTLLSWFTKFEFRDFYYKKGFRISINSEVFPVLKLGVGFLNRSDNNAVNNSDFSLLHKNRIYRVNPPIFETKINALTTNFTFDFRDYIEDGYSRRRTWRGNYLPIISGDFTFSSKSILHSNLNFQMYRTSVFWRIHTFKTAALQVNFDGLYSHGAVPYQMMYALPGNINAGGKNFSFRTLGIGDVFGDRIASLNIEHNFNDELFRFLKIPYLKDMRLIFYTYLNIAISDISPESKSILPVSYKTFEHPFYEIGFGIGQALLPIRFEFTWKLNYRGENNFVFGINTFAF